MAVRTSVRPSVRPSTRIEQLVSQLKYFKIFGIPDLFQQQWGKFIDGSNLTRIMGTLTNTLYIRDKISQNST